ncbi:hypothetical protein GOB57_22225 [Sinorhizobium meliloti]|nr:hypothetical protein [Sinorhizobium meliloti]
MPKYLAFSGHISFGETDTLAESMRRFFTMGTNDLDVLPRPSPYLIDHGLEGNDYDQMMLALRRAGYALEINVSTRPAGRTMRLNLGHCFTPGCALQQAVCDIAEGVSIDEARAKLAADIRAWMANIGHEANNVSALEVARHIAKDVGNRFSAALMPIPRFFDAKEKKAAETLALLERRATWILEDAHRRIMGPWPSHSPEPTSISPRP